MPRKMPPLATSFANAVTVAVGIADAGEIVRAGARKGSPAYRELRPSRLEALHEMAYLRVFVEWENFLEATFLRMQCGFVSKVYAPVLAAGKSREPTLAAARADLYDGLPYGLWHNPSTAVSRAQARFVDAPHELVILSNLARLEWFAAVRHGIAHGSEDARLKLDAATVGLAGRRYRGSSAGRFLRDWEPGSVPARRWLHAIADELSSLASQFSP